MYLQPKIVKLEKIFKALANRKRLKILFLLKENQTLTISEVCQKIDLSFKSTSKHLQRLADVGFIKQDRQGFYKFHTLHKKFRKLLPKIEKFTK